MTNKPENMDQVWAELGEIEIPSSEVIKKGWPTLDANTGDPEPPFHTYMNYIQNKCTKFLAHVNEYGIAFWDATTTYKTESWTRSALDHKVYISNIANNIGIEPSANPAEWTKFDVSANIGDTLESYETPPVMQARGYLATDGQAVSRTTYAELFALIGTEFGPGDGSTTFNLPGDFITGGDGFVLLRSDFPEDSSSIRVNKNGEMFVSAGVDPLVNNDIVAYKYNNTTDESYSNIKLENFGGSILRDWKIQSLSDDSIFVTGEEDPSTGSNKTAIYEYKNNGLLRINLGVNFTVFGGVQIFDVDENREIISFVEQNGIGFTAQNAFVYNSSSDILTQTQIPSPYFNNCTTFPNGQKSYGGLACLKENNRSFSFFGGISVTPSIQHYSFPGNNFSSRSFSSCGANQGLDGFKTVEENAAYFQSAIYKTASIDFLSPGVVFKTEANGSMAKVSDTPPGTRMAGIYNGDIYVYYYSGGEPLKLFRKESRAKWIKAI